MVVAMSAFQRYSQKGLSECVGTVCYIGHPILFIDHPTLFRDLMIPVETCSQKLFLGMPRYLVACQLPGDKVFIREILVIGMDHPIAPWPLCAIIIILVPMRVGISRNIEPMQRHFFAILGASHQLVDYFFIGLRAIIRQEFIH